MSDTSDPVAALYDSTGKLSSALTAGTIASETDAYSHLISSVSSPSDAAKQLAADSLPAYFHHFPAQSDAALSAYFDLIEDANAATRLRAIKGVEALAKNSSALVPRLADVLAQLLVSDAEHERASVRAVFSALFALDSRACFGVLFAAIRDADADNDKLRERAVEYLQAQLHKQWKALSGKDASDELQAEIAAGIKAVLAVEGLSEKESRTLVSKLMSLRVVKSDANAKSDLAAIIASQAKLDKDFEPASEDAVDAFVSGLRAAHANKRHGIDSEAFLTYFSDKVLPVFDQIPASKRAVVIRQITNHVQTVDAKLARSLLEAVWGLTKSYLPATKTASNAAADEASHNHFSIIESLLYLLHILASSAPSDAVRDVLGFFVATGQPSDARAEALKRDTLARLSQLSSATQQWGAEVAKELEEARKQAKEQKELTDDDKKAAGKRRATLSLDAKVAASIAELVKPLTGKTHAFVKDAKLSWRGGKDDRKTDAKGGKDGKRKGDGKQPQEAGQGAKKHKAGKEQAAAGNDGADRKKKNGQEAGAADGASRKGKRGRDGQADDGGSQQPQQQQEGRGKKRKSEGGNQQQPAQQQSAQQAQQASKKRKGNNQPASGAQQPNPAAYQQMAAAMMHNPQMMQAMAMGMHMAAMQQQQQGAQTPLSSRRGGGGGRGGGQQQQQPPQQQQRSQQQQGGTGGGGRGGQKRKGRA